MGRMTEVDLQDYGKIKIDSLPTLSIKDHERIPESCNGIYFIILKNEIVYIGRSIRIKSRIKNHISTKKFNIFGKDIKHLMVSWLAIENGGEWFIENTLIKKINPKLNVVGKNLDMTYGKIKYNEILNLKHNGGMSVMELASRCHVCLNTIYRWIYQNHCEYPRPLK
jgi:hypothetical protein